MQPQPIVCLDRNMPFIQNTHQVFSHMCAKHYLTIDVAQCYDNPHMLSQVPSMNSQSMTPQMQDTANTLVAGYTVFRNLGEWSIQVPEQPGMPAAPGMLKPVASVTEAEVATMMLTMATVLKRIPHDDLSYVVLWEQLAAVISDLKAKNPDAFTTMADTYQDVISSHTQRATCPAKK